MTEHSLDGRRSAVRRRAGVLAGAALFLGTAMGCSSGDNPAPDPLDPGTSAASTTPSSTPSPSGPPTLPPQAQGTSDKAAIAFVEHWVESLNHATSAGAPESLNRLSAPTCDLCSVVSGQVEQVVDGNGSFRGEGWRVADTQYLAGQPMRHPVVRAVIDIAPQVVIESEGAKPQRFDGGRALYTFHLRWTDGRWLVQSVERAT
jgi:hypothetical protein